MEVGPEAIVKEGKSTTKPRCRFCKSADVVKAGKRYNRFGEKQHWLCKACNRRFTPDDGFLSLWYSKHTVVEAIDLHYEGLSTH